MSMSKIFANAAQNAVEEEPSTGGVILPGQPKDTPISQQKFAMDRSVQNPDLPNIQPTYVPGIGVLGADLGGAVKGTLLRQQYRMNEAENARAEENLGITKAQLANQQKYVEIAQQQLGISLNDAAMSSKKFEDEQQLQQGMMDAAKQGGYAQVIDYLKLNNPMQALVFQTAKLQLDDSIMKNQVMQAKLPNELDQALFDTYALGAKMAAGIASAPQELQAEMYKQALPMIKKIIPDAPNEYNSDAVAMGQLLIAQGMPENLVAANQGLSHWSNTEVGKLTLAKKEAIQAFGVNSEEAIGVQTQIDALTDKANMASINAENIKASILQKTQSKELALPKIALSYNNSIHSASKFFIDNANDISGIEVLAKEAQAAYEKGETNPTAMAALQGKIVKVNSGGGAPSESDAKRAVASAGLGNISKNVEGWMRGENIPLKPWEVKQALLLAKVQKDGIIKRQTKLEDQYRNSLKDNPDILDRIVWPSKAFEENNQIDNVKKTGGTVKYNRGQIDQMYQEGLSALQKLPPDRQEAARQKMEALKAKLYNDNGIEGQ